MLEIIKKVFKLLSNNPLFSKLFKSIMQTGKIDPLETLNALSSISPSTQKVANVAMDTAQRGGGISDVAKALSNIGEVEVMGQKLNTKTLPQDLKKAGGICSVLANVLEKMQGQSTEEIVDFGNAATNVKNWQDIAGDKSC